jgi:hypothetical protein
VGGAADGTAVGPGFAVWDGAAAGGTTEIVGVAGWAVIGVTGAPGFAAGTAAVGGTVAGLIAVGAETVGATATGPGAEGAGAGLVRAAFVVASLACDSAASAAASASEAPLIWRRTFTATSSGMELECVFFSVTP